MRKSAKVCIINCILYLQVNGLDNKVRELETFKKIHEKDIKKLEGEISVYQGRVPTLEDSVRKLEEELRKAKNELESESRVSSLQNIVFSL